MIMFSSDFWSGLCSVPLNASVLIQFRIENGCGGLRERLAMHNGKCLIMVWLAVTITQTSFFHFKLGDASRQSHTFRYFLSWN